MIIVKFTIPEVPDEKAHSVSNFLVYFSLKFREIETLYIDTMSKVNAMAEEMRVEPPINVDVWLPFSQRYRGEFVDLAREDRCVCLFQDGTSCNYNDMLPEDIITHFKMEKYISC